jgi:hypothetical protein
MFHAEMRLTAMRAFAAASFNFTAHERAVLKAAANAIAPGTDITGIPINTRLGPKSVPSAGNAGAVDYIELLLQGTLLYSAGTQRPPYVKLPAGVVAKPFPSTGADPLWTVKKMGWFGDNRTRPTRPFKWPSELAKLQKLYQDGVVALDGMAFPTASNLVTLPVQTVILTTLYTQEFNQYNANPLTQNDPYQGAENSVNSNNRHQPFFFTMLDHVCEACFGDPVYGGNKSYVYWDMINFTGPSYINKNGPAPGQGWSWFDMTTPYDRTKVVAKTPPPG